MIPKSMLKSWIVHNLSEKAKMLQTCCFTIENVVLDIEKVVKNRKDSIENRYQKNTWEKYRLRHTVT